MLFEHPPVIVPVAFAITLCLELLLRQGRNRLPFYRRHTLLWSLVVLACLAWELRSHPSPRAFLGAAAGSMVALGLTSIPFLRTRRLGGFSWQRGSRRRPDPERPLILVADSHWGEEAPGFRETALAYPEADWLFLGDIFDLWVGVPGQETEAQRSFLWWVRERRRLGRWVGFWMGNREYALDGLSSHFDLIGEGVGGALADEGLVWEHGDLINGHDWRYRIWNLFSRSGFAWILGCILPSGWLRRRLANLEKAMRTVNSDYRLRFPREAFRAAAQAHPGKTFITGHFHSYEVEANGTALPWAHEGNFMLWHEGRIQPLPFKRIS